MTRVLYDSFHHMMPGHRIGSHIAVGGYNVNLGRYTPGDCYHPNGLSFTHADLAADYDLRLLTEPYSDLSMFDADILLVANPDYPTYEGASPHRLTPKDVDALMRFAERGGGVLLLVNSFLSRPDYWEENFDLERVSLLFDRLGVRWDPNYMSDDNNIELAQSGPFRIGYGQGGRVVGGTLPPGVTPLITYRGNVYGIQTQVGRGLLAVIGDAGMVSNGLVCFPGYDNAAFIKKLFADLTPAWRRGSPVTLEYRSFGHLSAAPSRQGMNEEVIRGLRPGAEWMEDHHYRHLTWEGKTELGVGEDVWKNLPVDVGGSADQTQTHQCLRWLRLDSDRPGPEVEIPLTVNVTRRRDSADVHLIWRVCSESLSWADLCETPGRMDVAGRIQQAHAVFEMKAVLDETGRCCCARWTQGQILYASSSKAVHYGYEILLNSQSGVIAPRAGSAPDA